MSFNLRWSTILALLSLMATMLVKIIWFWPDKFSDMHGCVFVFNLFFFRIISSFGMMHKRISCPRMGMFGLGRCQAMVLRQSNCLTYQL